MTVCCISDAEFREKGQSQELAVASVSRQSGIGTGEHEL
jgi:hypothetical protein